MAACRFFRPIVAKVSRGQAEAVFGGLNVAYSIGVSMAQTAINKHYAQPGNKPVKSGGNVQVDRPRLRRA